MKVSTTGQFGNWLWHFFSGVKLYGSVKAIQCCGCNWNEHKRGQALFNALLPSVRVFFGEADKNTIQIHKHSCWQSLGSIPSREDCKRLINLPTCEPETRPVIHVRGGDYLRYFHQSASSITLSTQSILSLCERFGEKPENCVVVTDDPTYVKSLGIKFAEIRSKSTYEDWIYLANAERLAISPSTYSWWAGFLGQHKQVLVPQGIGPWDTGVLDNDPYSANFNKDLCWGEEAEVVPVLGDDTVYLLFCTGVYKELFDGFYRSFREYYPTEPLLVFTDCPEDFQSYDCKTVKVEHKAWPWIVMKKYYYLLTSRHLILGHRNVVCLQVNMRFKSRLDVPSSGVTLCFHPWGGEISDYVCGGLVGGESTAFVEMAKDVDEWLDNNPSPQWHDETAVNEYYKKHRTSVHLLPSCTMWAEETPQMETEKSSILLLDKHKFFGKTKFK